MIPILNPTGCCSLCQVRADNETSFDELRALIDLLKDEAFSRKWYMSGFDGGYRSAFCVTTPNETTLERNLAALGFVGVTTFPRRTGYPDGLLTMWMLSW